MGKGSMIEAVERILRGMSRQRVVAREPFDPYLVRFVGREAEGRVVLKTLAGIAERGERLDGSYGFTVLAGPEGCGKSAFFRALYSSMVDNYEPGLEMIYIEDLGGEIGVAGTKGVGEAVKIMARGIRGSVRMGRSRRSLFLRFRSPTITNAAFLAVDAVENLIKATRRSMRVLIVADKYRDITASNVKVLRKTFDSYAGSLQHVNSFELFNMKTKMGVEAYIRVILIAGTPLALETDVGGAKQGYNLMWNLPRRDADALADELGMKVDRDLLWRLAGGNPRMMIKIREREKQEKDPREALLSTAWGLMLTAEHIFDIARYRGLTTELKEFLTGSKDYISLALEYFLMEENIISRTLKYITLTEVPKDYPRISESLLYQIPGYYYALKLYAEKGKSDGMEEELLKMIERSS